MVLDIYLVITNTLSASFSVRGHLRNFILLLAVLSILQQTVRRYISVIYLDDLSSIKATQILDVDGRQPSANKISTVAHLKRKLIIQQKHINRFKSSNKDQNQENVRCHGTDKPVY